MRKWQWDSQGGGGSGAMPQSWKCFNSSMKMCNFSWHTGGAEIMDWRNLPPTQNPDSTCGKWMHLRSLLIQIFCYRYTLCLTFLFPQN